MLQIIQKIPMFLASFIRRHPRLPRLIILRALAASFALGGCVPSTTYEEAQSAAQVEREGHRRTAAQLEAKETELAREKAEKLTLAKQKSELERRLVHGESQLAQVSLDRETSEKASEQHSELVTQLRGELARVGDHLKEFEGDKLELREQLSETQALLAEKDRQIALLEDQIARLKMDGEKSADAQQQLSGALEDLANLRRGQGDQTNSRPSSAPDDKPSENESPKGNAPSAEGDEIDAGEVLPSEEG